MSVVSVTPDVAVWQPLFQLQHALAADEPLPRILRQGVETAAALVQADDVLLFLFSEGGTRALELRVRWRDGSSLEGPALAAANALLRQEPANGEGGQFRAVAVSGGTKPFGALVAARRAGPSFSPGEEQLLRAVADSVATGLQTADLYAAQHHRTSELRLLTEIANESRGQGLDQFFPAITERVYRAFDLRLSLLVVLDRQRGELVWAYGMQDGKTIGPPIRRFPATNGIAGRALRTRQPVRGTPATIEDPRMRALAEAANLGHLAAVPLLVQDRGVGVLVTGRDSPLDDDDLRLLMAIGVQLAVAADNTRLLAETRQHTADITLVQSIGAAMAHSLDPGAILRVAVEMLQSAMQCDGVRLYRRKGTVFELSTRRGFIPGAAVTALSLEQDSDIIRRVFAAGRAIDLPTDSLDPTLREALSKIRVVRSACVPLWITLEDRAESSPTGSFGMLVVVRQTQQAFSPSELGVLDAVGGQLAIAFRNAELYEEMRRQAEDLTIVNEAGRALLGGAPLQSTLEEVSARLAQLARVPRCVFLLANDETRELHGTFRDPDGTPHELHVGLDTDCLVAEAARTRKPCPNPAVPAAVSTCVAKGMEQPAWALALPLESQERVVGVVLLLDDEAGRILSVNELNRATAVANQVAIAIDRASLHEQLQQSLLELEQAQRELVQRERLAALGRLSAQVAHEVRNPLGVIMNSLGLLAKLTALQGDALRTYRIMQEEVKRLDGIVGSMLDYTRPMDARLAPVDVGTVLRSALASVQTAERTRGTPVDTVETTVTIAPGLPPVPLDERLIHQALVNLLTNAYQALNGHGALRLEGSLDGSGTGVQLSVHDTGPGLPEAHRAQIFEPFFTTKAKGSGLGLAVVKRIVDAHHGEIVVESAPGQGTRFTMVLPISRMNEASSASKGAGR